jgi:hypothetical protein
VAWTTQGFAPGAPYIGPAGKDFVPFGVGLVNSMMWCGWRLG